MDFLPDGSWLIRKNGSIRKWGHHSKLIKFCKKRKAVKCQTDSKGQFVWTANLNDMSRFGNIRMFNTFHKTILSFSNVSFLHSIYQLCTDIFIPTRICISTNMRKNVSLFQFVPNIKECKMVMVQNVSRNKKLTFYFTIALDQHLTILYGSSW